MARLAVHFMLDADGAIKLAKAQVLQSLAVAEFAKCTIPKQAYAEVLKGKENMHEDAFVIENLVKKRKINTVATQSISVERNLGAGEREILAVFHKTGADAVISDDRKFLSVLDEKRINYVIPTEVIAMLEDSKIISKTQAKIALEHIRPFVREENYQEALKAIGGK